MQRSIHLSLSLIIALIFLTEAAISQKQMLTPAELVNPLAGSSNFSWAIKQTNNGAPHLKMLLILIAFIKSNARVALFLLILLENLHKNIQWYNFPVVVIANKSHKHCL